MSIFEAMIGRRPKADPPAEAVISVDEHDGIEGQPVDDPAAAANANDQDVTDLVRVLQLVASEAGGIGVEIADVAGNIADVSDRIQRQSEVFRDSQSGPEAMIRGNHEISVAARRCEEVAATAGSEVDTSRQRIAGSLTEIKALVDAVGNIGHEINGLCDALDKVATVADSINAIATKTNLLALNATIEAARAGEYGKGFSMVAGEVKQLARQTSESTGQIGSTLKGLQEQIQKLVEISANTAGHVESVEKGTTDIDDALNSMGAAIERVRDEVRDINSAADEIENRATTFKSTITEIADDIARSSEDLATATGRVDRLQSSGETMLGLTAEAGIETVDTPFVNAAQEAAARMVALLETALDEGRIDLAGLFDEDYQPVPGSNPPQVMAKFTALTDELFPAVQEPILSFDPRVVYCAAIDRNAYLPTHNKKFSKPQGSDVEWNMANCRNRRIWDNRAGLAAAKNTKPFLLQTYRRPMGGGKFELMKKVSAPIYIKGRHWGGLRIAYSLGD